MVSDQILDVVLLYKVPSRVLSRVLDQTNYFGIDYQESCSIMLCTNGLLLNTVKEPSKTKLPDMQARICGQYVHLLFCLGTLF